MNKYLMDTHIFLWSLLETEKLSSRTIEILNDAESALFISPISIWETAILAEKKRIELNEVPDVWIRNVLKVLPIYQAPLNIEVALRSRQLMLPHQDPADRFIAATAEVYDCTLITADARLIAGAGSYAVFANQ